MSEHVLELHDTAVAYDGRTVLEVPSLDVARGEVLTLLGENGSGKTTLLRLLGLLVQPVRGRVVFGGEEVDFGRAGRLLGLRRQMAAVMQEPLLCRMSVRRNVGLGLRFRRMPKAEIEERVEKWLERLSIASLGDRPAWKVSGGEAQRTSLARAMVLDPEVLFLDEPFAALDAPTRQSLLQEFRAVLAESGVTAIFATHDRGEALALGGRVAVLVQGSMAQVGPVEEVFTRPKHEEVARFVGIETLIPGRVGGCQGGMAQVACGDFDLQVRDREGSQGDPPVGKEVLVAVRPEEIALEVADGPTGDATRNRIQGRVTMLVPGESHYRVEVDCGVPVVASIGRTRIRELGLGVGQPVHAVFPPSVAHLIVRTGPFN